MSVDSITSPLFCSLDQLRRHIFLIGETHCGKSTIIHRVLMELEINRLIAGFYTFFSHDNAGSEEIKSGTKKLYIAPSNHILAGAENHHLVVTDKPKLVVEWSPEQTTVYTEVFNSYGVELLCSDQQTGTAPGIIVMDECGRFEADAFKFKSAIFAHLDGTIPVFGIIRKLNYPTWLDLIKAHQNVSVIEVTKENQNEICAALVTHLKNITTANTKFL